jgi:hypothetical protein
MICDLISRKVSLTSQSQENQSGSNGTDWPDKVKIFRRPQATENKRFNNTTKQK